MRAVLGFALLVPDKEFGCFAGQSDAPSQRIRGYFSRNDLVGLELLRYLSYTPD